MDNNDAAAERACPAIDRVLTDGVCAQAAPGLVGIVADRSGVLYAGASGVAEIGGSRQVATDTIFWLASMTKLVTTIAALQLVEQGRLDLDVPVAALLPELAKPMVLDGRLADGAPALRLARTEITLRHLLSHSSGMGYDLMNPRLLAARGAGGPPPATLLSSLHGPLVFDPGAGWEYGVGVDWAGIAVERCTGMTLDRYFADCILGPLGMTNTGFGTGWSPVGRAGFHMRNADGGLVPMPSPAGADEDWTFRSGGAGLSGTAVDYIRLLRMVLRGGELDGVRILSAATVADMWCNQIGSVPAGRVGTAMPALFLPFDPLPGQAGEWSFLGVVNPRDLPQRRRAGSATWVGAAGTWFWIDRQTGICAVLLAQLLPFADPVLTGFRAGFEATVYANLSALRDARGAADC